MPIDWNDVRYTGDAQDIEELFKTYPVEDYLEAYEKNLQQRDQGFRDHLLKKGIRLTESLSPRIHRIFKEVCQALEIESKEEIFCLPDQEVNAAAILDVLGSGKFSLIGITSAALEKLKMIKLSSFLASPILL